MSATISMTSSAALRTLKAVVIGGEALLLCWLFATEGLGESPDGYHSS